MARLTALAGAVAATGMVAVMLPGLPALAHEHPSGITDLVTPAVVRVEATAHVEITLLDHIGDLVHVERAYDIPIGKGTGLVVNPEGAIVTLTRIVQSAEDVRLYAANKVFSEHHKVKVPLDFKRHRLDDPQLDRHLRDCYPPKRATATCLINVTPSITIFPNISPPDPKGFAAEIVKAGTTPDSPAVLVPTGRADGSAGMPTAPLADKVPDKQGSPTNVAGFLGRPAPRLQHTVEIAHLGQGGAGAGGRPFADPEKKVDEPVKLGGLADKGMLGAPVIGDKDGHVIGMLVGGGKDARMIGVREITGALAGAGVTPRRGAIDANFEAALTRFHTKYYTLAAPGFQRVMELYPGHIVAGAHLKTALAKRGTAEDAGTRQAPVNQGGSMPLWPFIAAAGVLFVAAAAGAVLLWRRRRTPEPPPAAPPPIGGALPRFDEGSTETVVVRRDQALQPAPNPVLTAPEQRYCTGCGMRLGQGHRFCGYCGLPT
ncbi:hypothetical protein [Nonomuraea typhae]|uniref:hypothetical protein n=1 Tax=Nonomuraea typhae TaxID=2603600 RepID=UPI0012F8ACDB|nr:hypothetical protein [Nonomuraea typhae]